MKKSVPESLKLALTYLVSIIEDEKRIMDSYCNQWIAVKPRRIDSGSSTGSGAEVELVCS